MKFVISKTSLYNDEEKPIEEAYEGTYTYVDIRCVSKPIDIPYYNGNEEYANNDWYSEGRNHRLINGEIARNLNELPCWYIDVNSLEDLLKLKEKYGEIILKDKNNAEGVLELEIYDSYR